MTTIFEVLKPRSGKHKPETPARVGPQSRTAYGDQERGDL